MNQISQIAQEVLRRTNGGSIIIYHLFPQASVKQAFKMRDERTASSSMHKMPDGNYIIKDFGSGKSGRNAIHLYAEENGLDYTHATLQLAKQYNISTGFEQEKNEAKFRKIDQSEWNYDQEFEETNFCFETKDFTDKELNVLGPFVDAKTCEKYSLYSLKWYATKKEGKITIVEPTETFPIFIFVFGEAGKRFYKILQPKSPDKTWRFFWKGKKPSDFIGGLSVLAKEYNKRKEKELDDPDTKSAEDADKAAKIEKAFICSGERDAMNMASLGYFVLWQNSETAELKPNQYKEIAQKVEALYNVPDLDETGKRQGHEMAMKYLKIHTLWLPSWLKKRKDWRGNPRKDLCDFFEIHAHAKKYEVEKKLKDLKAFPMQFWNEEKNAKTGKIRYSLNLVHLFNFLHRNGFYRLDVPTDKEGFKYVYIKEHVVEDVDSNKVVEFVNNFAEQRCTTAVRNMLYERLNSGNQLMKALKRLNLDFDNSSRTGQYFFFDKFIWKISAKGIQSYEQNIVNKYIWQRDLMENQIEKQSNVRINPEAIKLENPYFKIERNEQHYRIEILEKNCDWLNFMTQTSRIHWKAEIAGMDEDEIEAYYKKHRYAITSERLTEEQNAEQMAHLVNKIFAMGYLLHNYKSPSKAWLVYAMENGLIEDDESRGGSGKSILLKAPSYLVRSDYKGARNPKIWENTHLFENVTEDTRYVLFDDADKYLDLGKLYTCITGDLDVNPKNNKQYSVPFHKSPKFAVTSNYSLRQKDSSTFRRVLFVATSDFYHSQSDEYDTERTAHDDFGHNLFIDWTSEQWVKFINCSAQSVQFYLGIKDKINPPMNGLEMRNLQATIGVSFMDWAESYLEPRLNKPFKKIEALENLQAKKDNLRNITRNNFIKKTRDWCKFKGYSYMPKDATSKEGRIQKKGRNGKVEDFLLIANAVISKEDVQNRLTEIVETDSKGKSPF